MDIHRGSTLRRLVLTLRIKGILLKDILLRVILHREEDTHLQDILHKDILPLVVTTLLHTNQVMGAWGRC